MGNGMTRPEIAMEGNFAPHMDLDKEFPELKEIIAARKKNKDKWVNTQRINDQWIGNQEINEQWFSSQWRKGGDLGKQLKCVV